ncbi:hypothetical protein FQZ97_1232900 [compost metagenome]
MGAATAVDHRRAWRQRFERLAAEDAASGLGQRKQVDQQVQPVEEGSEALIPRMGLHAFKPLGSA